jgi:hypothetical protein
MVGNLIDAVISDVVVVMSPAIVDGTTLSSLMLAVMDNYSTLSGRRHRSGSRRTQSPESVERVQFVLANVRGAI